VSKAQYKIFLRHRESETIRRTSKDEQEHRGRGRIVKREVARTESNRMCRRIVVPYESDLKVGYAVKGMRETEIEDPSGVKFSIRVVDQEGGEANLLSDTMGMEEETKWRDRKMPLDRWAGKKISLCFEAMAEDKGLSDFLHDIALWRFPVVGTQQIHKKDADLLRRAIDRSGQREKSILERQLRALGYAE
jgi:hypothetical protein